MSKTCQYCELWKRVESDEVYGYCQYMEGHTTMFFGTDCSRFQASQAATVRQDRLKPGTLYEKALQVIAGWRKGECDQPKRQTGLYLARSGRAHWSIGS